MKIISIQIIEEKHVMSFNDGTYLLPVHVVARKWYGTKYSFDAYPTHVGITGKKGGFLYHYYCDELGKKLSDDISEQISSYILVYRMNKK